MKKFKIIFKNTDSASYIFRRVEANNPYILKLNGRCQIIKQKKIKIRSSHTNENNAMKYE